jgi:beta-glucanase (GH16 family)
MNTKKTTMCATKLVLILNAGLIGLAGCGGSSNNSSPASSSAALSSTALSSTALSSVAPSSQPASSAAASSVSGTLPGNGWELVWSDEFSGSEIDSAKWSHEKNCTGGGNNELQCYTARSENSYVQDGHLVVVARKESFSGQAKGDDEPDYDAMDSSVARDYTSARLRTKNKGDWKYGRMEISAKMPQGQGIWPAIWMLPTEWKYGGWPLSGEIDIFEAVNSNTAGVANQMHGTLHYGRSWPNNSYTGASFSPATNIWDGFHRYAVEWEEGEIRWYVDSEHFATQTSDGWFTYYWNGQTQGYQYGTGAAPFDQNFHLILNLAVGGNWPGNPNAQTQFPQQMQVDYVRIYQCSKNTATGKGCASPTNPAVQPLQGTAKPAVKEFSLFNNGASKLSFNVNGTEVTNQLNTGFYDGGNAGNVVSNPAFAQGDAQLWDLMFNAAPGNAFLMSGDMSSSTLVDNGFKFTNMATSGEIKFDLYVDAIDSATKLQIKLDSGWPNVSYSELSNLKLGEWQSVSVPFSALKANNIQAGAVNFDSVQNPFVIEPSGGTAQVKINNLRIKCVADCSILPIIKGVSTSLSETFSVFDDAVDANWDVGLAKWDEGGDHIAVAIVDATEPARGKVVDVKYQTATKNGVAFIQSFSTKNLSAFAEKGYVEFDVKVLDYGKNIDGLVIKADCVNPCGSGDIALGRVAEGVWETFTIPVATYVQGGLNLTKVNTPFVILPTWGQQEGVHLQLDNIRWVNP